MKQQNQNEIQKLFDDYAESLSPQPQLASRAKERYLSMQVAQKPRRAVWAAAVCAVIVFVIAAAAVLPVLTGGGEPQVYAASQTAGQRVDADFASEIVNLQAFEGSAYSIVSQKYYAFRLDGNVVYVAAQLGFSTDQGIVEVQFVAEKDGFVRLGDQRLLQGKRHALLRLHAVQPLCGAIRAADFANYVLKRGQNGISPCCMGKR